MFKKLLIPAALLGFGVAQTFAQNVCPKFMLDSALIVNIEGRFINVQQTRSSIDVEWRHHPEALDTFFVSMPTQKPFAFVTAGEFRYMEYKNPKVKRQLGLHHLRETIGNTPLKLDDLELLANGLFQCQDSTTKNPNAFGTAFSNMWWSMTQDVATEPKTVTMRGARKETRTFTIGAWKDFSGTTLPTLVTLSSEKYSGSIWVRSVYAVQQNEKDPLLERAKRDSVTTPTLFRKTLVDGERKVPLILKLNQEFLRD